MSKREVFCRFHIKNISVIDTVAQQFTCRVVVEAWWHDPSLKGKKTSEINVDEIWHPQLGYKNILTAQDAFHTVSMSKRSTPEQPIAMVSMGCRGVFTEQLELQDFPFDYQDLTVTLISALPSDEVVLVHDSAQLSAIAHTSFILSEWVLHEPTVTDRDETDIHDSFNNDTHSLYHICMRVTRNSSFYLSNVVLPLFMITTLAGASFAVPHTVVASRLGITLTLILTSVAFKFVVAQKLPALPYSTELDSYVLMSLVFLIAVAVENVIAGIVRHDHFDTAFFLLIALAWVLYHIYLFVSIRRRVGQVMESLEVSNHAWQERQAAIGFQSMSYSV